MDDCLSALEIEKGREVLEAAGLDPVKFARAYSYLLSQLDYIEWQIYRSQHADCDDELPWESE